MYSKVIFEVTPLKLSSQEVLDRAATESGLRQLHQATSLDLADQFKAEHAAQVAALLPKLRFLQGLFIESNALGGEPLDKIIDVLPHTSISHVDISATGLTAENALHLRDTAQDAEALRRVFSMHNHNGRSALEDIDAMLKTRRFVWSPFSHKYASKRVKWAIELMLQVWSVPESSLHPLPIEVLCGVFVFVNIVPDAELPSPPGVYNTAVGWRTGAEIARETRLAHARTAAGALQDSDTDTVDLSVVAAAGDGGGGAAVGGGASGDDADAPSSDGPAAEHEAPGKARKDRRCALQ